MKNWNILKLFLSAGFFFITQLSCIAQEKFEISSGLGLNYSEGTFFSDEGYRLEKTLLIYKIGVSYNITPKIIVRVDFCSGSYDTKSFRLSNFNDDIKIDKMGLNLGMQYNFYSIKNFNFKTGYALGYHTTYHTNTDGHSYRGYYKSFAINILSIEYRLNNFGFNCDTYIGGSMYSNIYLGVSYHFLSTK